MKQKKKHLIFIIYNLQAFNTRLWNRKTEHTNKQQPVRPRATIFTGYPWINRHICDLA